MKIKKCRQNRKHFNKMKLAANAKANAKRGFVGRYKIAKLIERGLSIEHNYKPNPMKKLSFGIKKALFAPKEQ